MIELSGAPLWQRISEHPVSGPGLAAAEAKLADIGAAMPAPDLLAHPKVRQLLLGVIEGSPYLTGLMLRDPGRVVRILECMPESQFEIWRSELRANTAAAASPEAVMTLLRRFKTDVALLAALADLGGVWPVMTVTHVLTRTADAALEASVDFLFARAIARGDWLP